MYTTVKGWTISIVRDTIDAYEVYSNPDSVLIVDCSSFNDRMFSAFLKPLENPNMLGEIWFYNLNLSKYPFTIRSRCVTMRSPVDGLTLDFREQLAKYYEGDSNDIIFTVSRLLPYGFKLAVDMAKSLGDFVELLNCLDMSENFSVFMSHMDKVNYTYTYLLCEWLDGSEIFTNNQLMKCSWLPSVDLYIDTRMSNNDIKAIFIQLFAHKMIKT